MSSQKQITQDAKAPDRFLTLSDKILKWVERNAKWAASGIVIMLLIGVGILSNNYLKSRAELRAAKDIYNAEQPLNERRIAFAKAENERLEKLSKELSDKKGAKAPDLKPAEIDFDKELSGLAKNVEAAIISHKDTNAAAIAAIELAGLYLNHKKGDLAQSILDQVKAKSDVLSALVDAQKATLALEQGQLEQALSAFEQIVQKKQVAFLHPLALLKMGLCYEKMNQPDRARETYQRVSTEFADSESGRTAKGYLRLLELNQPTEQKGS